ncbi:hypothetical protein ACQJBY_063955 [Aegilops geniculata]
MLPDLVAPGFINTAPVVHLPITAFPVVIPSASSKSAERVVACLLRSSSLTASTRTPSPSLPTSLPSEHVLFFVESSSRRVNRELHRHRVERSSSSLGLHHLGVQPCSTCCCGGRMARCW